MGFLLRKSTSCLNLNLSRGEGMNWLLLLILIAGWYLTVDSAMSIAYRIEELNQDPISRGQKLEFVGRFTRGFFGLLLVVVAFILAL